MAPPPAHLSGNIIEEADKLGLKEFVGLVDKAGLTDVLATAGESLR